MNSEYQYERLFRALGDGHRLTILKQLAQREMNAGEILETVDVVQSTLSHHMKTLCESGLVIPRKNGKWTCYTLDRHMLKTACAYLQTLEAEAKQVQQTPLSGDQNAEETLQPEKKKTEELQQPEEKKEEELQQPEEKKEEKLQQPAACTPQAHSVPAAELCTPCPFPGVMLPVSVPEQRLPVLVTSTIITLPRVSLALQTCCFLWEFRLHQKNQNKRWTGRCRIISDLDTHQMK